MSDSGIEAAPDDGGASGASEALVDARMAALVARYPNRFSDEEAAAIRGKLEQHLAIAKTLHGAPLDPSIEPPPFVPLQRRREESG